MDEHLGVFYILAIMNKTTLHIFVYNFWWTYALISIGIARSGTARS